MFILRLSRSHFARLYTYTCLYTPFFSPRIFNLSVELVYRLTLSRCSGIEMKMCIQYIVQRAECASRALCFSVSHSLSLSLFFIGASSVSLKTYIGTHAERCIAIRNAARPPVVRTITLILSRHGVFRYTHESQYLRSHLQQLYRTH